MSTGAVVMMIIAMLVLWGGLALAILNITRFRGKEPRRVRRDL
jgi:cell division protein FtsX